MTDRSTVSHMRLIRDLDESGRSVGDKMLRWFDNAYPLGYHPIPEISIKGGDGRRVLIIGGTHGDKFEGPAAIMRLARNLSPETLEGQVVLIQSARPCRRPFPATGWFSPIPVVAWCDVANCWGSFCAMFQTVLG